MGHIQRRGDGRWRARYRETAGSKERSRTFSRRVDAERFLTGIEHSKLMGNYVDPSASRITFRLFARTGASSRSTGPAPQPPWTSSSASTSTR